MVVNCSVVNNMTNIEEWRDVKGYEGLYQVSNLGRVRSVSHYTRNNINGGERLTEGRILSQYKMPNGYYQVQFSKNEKRSKKYVHRLVADAFCNNENNCSDVNHIDGNKDNNTVENLEWVSHKDNQIHMIKARLTKKAKPVQCIETGLSYNSLLEAERETKVERHSIREACECGKAYKGFHWRYC